MEKKYKILVADDSKELSGIMQEMLVFKGYDVVTAYDGPEALSVALTEHPDLILLDVRMPKLDGYEVIKKLREDAWGAHVKILVLTAAGQIDDIPPGIGIKGTDYLQKSVWGIENVETRIRQKLAE